MAEHTGSEPLLISMLVASVVDDMACNTLQAVVRTRLPSAADLAGLDLDNPVAYQRQLERALPWKRPSGPAYSVTWLWDA